MFLFYFNFVDVNVDCNLNWNKHTEYIFNKISSGIFVLKTLSYMCDSNNLKTLNYALIKSHISHSIPIYLPIWST